ncbi:uncharacterized protein LOC106874652 [Octopus bimaculoides]|uniref:Uncharacterized protein n=1 Tax=Octopus bimaculoides TaxID=37653 RepID=A0A0L8GUR2_OCTBM|nr:uncharacterized protein LOC106874652 [Octopus bimaculoides]|eukprot:XP_014777932.1 PREDICTED: uncharacterized protein LOC106874652 [Octopus bimaculoides]
MPDPPRNDMNIHQQSDDSMFPSDDHLKDDNSADVVNAACINLDKGNQLSEETDADMYENVESAKKKDATTDESDAENTTMSGSIKKSESFLQKLNIPGLLKKKKSESKDEPKVFQIPANGNIIEFDVEEMCQFFSCFNVSQNLLETLRKKKVNGERFSRITDTELNNMKLNNVVICYFRSKCKKNANHNFML